MIHYNLICDSDHEFDSWFASSKAFDELKQSGLVTCPYCNSGKIEKSLMAPSIPAKANKAPSLPAKEQAVSQSLLSTNNDPIMKQLAENIRKLRQHVSENAEYVGKDFAKTAREIHYEEQPARGIYGEASLDEAKSLLEEGVEVMPLPALPEEKT